MTSEKDLRKIVSSEAELRIRPLDELRQKYPGLTPDDWDRISGLVETWPIPDLPEPDDDYPEWQVGKLSIVTGIEPGAVGLEWEDREDTGRGTVTRWQYLTPSQVQSIIAAHYRGRTRNEWRNGA